MLNATQYRQIISGRRRGWSARLIRCGLRLAEFPYTAAVQWRNRRYDQGHAKITQLAVPVISVGNLTLGGTGKTPTVAWLARWFRQHQVPLALVSRGYGARHRPSCDLGHTHTLSHQDTGFNDEALELQLLVPDVPHVQNADRVAAAQHAIAQHEAGLILLDDAFQHRRLHRDLDVVLVDACQPDGFGHVFPRGTLREPLAGLGRADVVILSRTDMIADAQRQAIWNRLAPLLADKAIQLEVTHQPTAWRPRSGPSLPLDEFRGKPVVAFCGIGNPAGFQHSLQTCQCEVQSFRDFPDHHPYDVEDLKQLDSWVRGLATAGSIHPKAVVCTLKDLVKFDRSEVGGLPLLALEIGMRPTENAVASWNEFQRLLKQFVRPDPPSQLDTRDSNTLL